MVRWGESGRERTAGFCGLSAMKALFGNRSEVGRSLGVRNSQSTALWAVRTRFGIQLAAKSRARGQMRESTAKTKAWLAIPVEGVAVPAAGMAILSLMFLSAALWNGFPLIFYDTGAYILEGLGHVFLVERAPVYAELLFLAGGAFSLWPIVVLQALMTSYIILEVARAEVPGLTLRGVVLIGAALTLLTGIAWYVGQVEPDIFTPMVILGSWLLLFRGDRLGKARLAVVTGLTALAVACHPSHLGLMGGLLISAALIRLGVRRWRLPRPNTKGGFIRPAAALCPFPGGHFALSSNVFIIE